MERFINGCPNGSVARSRAWDRLFNEGWILARSGWYCGESLGKFLRVAVADHEKPGRRGQAEIIQALRRLRLGPVSECLNGTFVF